MKYLFLIAVIGLVLWWLKIQRRDKDKNSDDVNQAQKAQHMVRCAHCDLHLPQSDALEGLLGFYCSASHRDAKED
jgi:uncharacterized protein